jgi:L-ascorbate metabolism protein UlaG (beta-lactamase superfamily)
VAPRVTWLGQSGFLLESSAGRLLVDPFFSDHEGRAYPPPSLDEHATGCDWLFVTHEHLDHLDRPALPEIARRSPGLRVVVPAPLEAEARGLAAGAPVLAARRGERIDLGAAAFATVVPAVHAVEPRDGYSDDPRFAGYVFDLDGVAVYHAGDTIVTDALLEGLRGVRVDIALLPVNGRDVFRERDGLAGNAGPREAVGLARHVGARVLVPMHWDGFAANGARPGDVVDEAVAADAPLHVFVPRRGVPWDVP